MPIDEKKYRLLESKIDALKVKDKDDDRRKTLAEVFDENTLLTLYKLFCDKVVDIVEYPVATGKEGNVYKGKALDGGNVAVKIFRTATSTFKHLAKYIVGDKRFSRIRPQSRHMIYAWAQKEYRNLELMHRAKVRVPKPLKCIDNVLVMGYIGDDVLPAPTLRNVGTDEPKKLFRDVATNMKRIYNAGLVHSDLSEYNILMWNGKAYIIDVGQAVMLDHSMAEEFLLRDVKNIVRYFNSQGLKKNEVELIKKIKGE